MVGPVTVLPERDLCLLVARAFPHLASAAASGSELRSEVQQVREGPGDLLPAQRGHLVALDRHLRASGGSGSR